MSDSTIIVTKLEDLRTLFREVVPAAVAPDEVYTATKAAAYFKVSKRTMLELLRKGKIKACRSGRDWRVLKSEINRYASGR